MSYVIVNENKYSGVVSEVSRHRTFSAAERALARMEFRRDARIVRVTQIRANDGSVDEGFEEVTK